MVVGIASGGGSDDAFNVFRLFGDFLEVENQNATFNFNNNTAAFSWNGGTLFKSALLIAFTDTLVTGTDVTINLNITEAQKSIDGNTPLSMLIESGEPSTNFAMDQKESANDPFLIVEFEVSLPSNPTFVLINSTNIAQTNFSSEDLSLNFLCNHIGDLTMTYTLPVYKDGVEQFVLDGTCNDDEFIGVTLNNENTTVGDLWGFGVVLEDTNGENNTGGLIFSNNLTIENQVPTVSEMKINSSKDTNFTDEDIFVSFIPADGDLDTLTADIRWLKDNVSQFIFTGQSITRDILNTFTLESENTSVNELWNAEVNITDGRDDLIVNATQLTVLSSITIPFLLINSTNIAQLNRTNETLSCNFGCEDGIGANTITFSLDFLENGTTPLHSIVDQSCTNPSFNTIELTQENTTLGSSYSCNVNLTNSESETTNTIFSNNITITARNPTLPTIISPLNNTDIGNSSVLFNCSNSIDPEGNNLFFELFGDANNPPTTLLQNTTTETFNYTTVGSSFLRCRTVTEAGGQSQFTDTRFIRLNSTQIFNTTIPLLEAYETETESRNITIAVNPFNTNDVSATLNYNDVLFESPTKTILVDNDELLTILFSQSIVSPINDTITALWNFTLDLTDGTTKTNAEQFTDDILPIDFGLCNATLTTPFLNYTFKDETTLDNLNASIVSSFDFSLTIGAIQKQFLLTNTTENPSYAFCAEPINRTFIVDAELDYAAVGFPQRSSEETLTLTNLTTNKELLLLKATQGATIVFQVINIAGQPINNVDAVVEKLISGSFQTIEQKITDDAGTVSFFLNPNDDYRFTFSKTGFVTQVLLIEPSSATFTVTLETTTAVNDTNINKGILFDIGPNVNTLENDTDVTFTFNISSSEFNLEEAGFTLRNSSQTFLGSDSCTTETGCISSVTIDTNSHKTISMTYFWIIDLDGDLVTANATRNWRILISGTRPSSFDNFISDVEKLGSGFNDFTKAIISFLIILFTVGSLSFKFGVFSPVAILAEIFVLVASLDSIGFIPAIGPFKNFITVITGLMFMVSAIYEFSRGGP